MADIDRIDPGETVTVSEKPQVMTYNDDEGRAYETIVISLKNQLIQPIYCRTCEEDRQGRYNGRRIRCVTCRKSIRCRRCVHTVVEQCSCGYVSDGRPLLIAGGVKE